MRLQTKTKIAGFSAGAVIGLAFGALAAGALLWLLLATSAPTAFG
ncbi:hypothetical protein V5F77_03650 [Xanthobacter sp. DSM 24535]